MKARVVVGEQVRAYCGTLAPEPRGRLKEALAALASGAGDVKALTDELAGLYRLRVGQHRIVFRYQGARIECFYAAPRATIYEFLAARFAEKDD